MKTKILNALKTTYAHLGLSDRVLDGVASLLEKTITDENGIDAAIKEAAIESMLKGYQSDIDSYRTRETTLRKEFDTYKQQHPAQEPRKDDPPKNESGDEVLRILNEIREENKQLRERLDASDAAHRKNSLMTAVRAALKGSNRDIDPLLDIVLSNPQVGDEDTEETLVAKYSTEYDDKYKALYGDGAVPPTGTSTPAPQGYRKGMFAGAIKELENRGLLQKDEQ